MIWRTYRCDTCGVEDDFPFPGEADTYEAKPRSHRGLDARISCGGTLHPVGGVPATIGVVFSNEESANRELGLRPGDPGYVTGGTLDRAMEAQGRTMASENLSNQIVEQVQDKKSAADAAKAESRRNDGDPGPLLAVARKEERAVIEQSFRPETRAKVDAKVLTRQVNAIQASRENPGQPPPSGVEDPRMSWDNAEFGKLNQGFDPRDNRRLAATLKNEEAKASSDLGHWLKQGAA